jgi:FAD/FMN-containing dehydrogenase
MTRAAQAALPIEALRAEITGRLITPDDADYDTARALEGGGFDRRPALIVRVAHDGDITRVVRLAREAGLELAVRSGGHSTFGHGVSDGGLVIDLSAMKALDIDPAARTAWAETGLTAGEVTRAAGEHGLAVGFGDTATVGIGGITVGGGIGLLSRRYGLTIDNVLGADVVTADGSRLRVDAEHSPDLFWAIRGGGGNFGVVTRFLYRLYPVRDVVGGMLFLPATPDVLAGFVAAAAAAPDEVTTILNVMTAPPMPFLPPEMHGSLVAMAVVVAVGDAETGERYLAPFRALATPLADLVRPMAYPEMFAAPPPEAPAAVVGRVHFMDHMDLDLARTIIEHLEASEAPMRTVQLRVLGGAVARVPNDATAYAHRQRSIMSGVMAFTNADGRERDQAWADGLADALRQGAPGAYVNFIADEDPARAREAYPGATWDRLVEVKRRYDPGNLFRLNLNIPPG